MFQNTSTARKVIISSKRVLFFSQAGYNHVRVLFQLKTSYAVFFQYIWAKDPKGGFVTITTNPISAILRDNIQLAVSSDK